ncbi:predicted protein [Scheffersomyces stipitis CBS 6054]|uniref:Histone deacetylase complex subunit SAP30 Sin3 binding domain-containing protein n=1 Tax=Scheffersomyces stipitis (strain ATCC 58785 / CBS 6054 / NBRC 10063 / NRRL Y-11545) TaxID=322104 RepID=A3LVB2_PICST|nr:predicted protein [Scheffersomyces stipitis CBS 6054]ABN66748.1 predicted protein [Scheffersomyces stipitis CBS 6054]KAG2734467.1 hypothetical protein G9P44_002473 [Scheffersomyces stipitis]
MARPHKESASESESNKYSNTSSTGTGTKSSQKAKTQAAIQAQQLFLSKHINSNGPQDQPKIHPLDFEKFDEETLVRYNKKYNLNLPNPVSINNDILNSEIGKKTYSKRNKSRATFGGITKPEMANHLKTHFMNLPTKENEILTNFLYKVKHQDNDFKLTFK